MLSGVKLIICSNTWSEELQALKPEDADYLRKNFFQAVLPQGWKWYLEDGEEDEIVRNPKPTPEVPEKPELSECVAAAGA